MGATLIAQVLEEYPQTDALFCTNDDFAIGAYFECVRRNIADPGQMAVAGFHGHDVGQVMVPRVASVITPREILGTRAGTKLLRRIQGGALTDPVSDLGYHIEGRGHPLISNH